MTDLDHWHRHYHPTIGRRTALVLLGALGAAVFGQRAGLAQSHSSLPRLAVVDPATSVATLVAASMREPLIPGADLPTNAKSWRSFFGELQRLGYREGDNISIEPWSALGTTNFEGRATIIQAVLESRPDIIVSRGNAWVPQLVAAITTVPIVAFVTDPIAYGIAVNLAQPEGNVTGFYARSGGEASFIAKLVQILKEAAPTATRVGWVRPRRLAAGPGGDRLTAEARSFVSALGVDLVVMPSDPPSFVLGDIISWMNVLVAELLATGCNGVVFEDAPEFNLGIGNYELWPHLLLDAELPGITINPEYARGGLLMSYGLESSASLYADMARYVDRILRGAVIADLPFQGASDYALSINRRTAELLDLTIPLNLLATAAEVIE